MGNLINNRAVLRDSEQLANSIVQNARELYGKLRKLPAKDFAVVHEYIEGGGKIVAAVKIIRNGLTESLSVRTPVLYTSLSVVNAVASAFDMTYEDAASMLRETEERADNDGCSLHTAVRVVKILRMAYAWDNTFFNCL